MKKLLLLLATVLINVGAGAQRVSDAVGRGLVAVPGQSGGNFVSWRVLGEEYYDVTYNLYAGGTRVATGLKTSCYSHAGGNAQTRYQVAAVVRGQEQALSAEQTRWENGMWSIPVKPLTGRDGTDVTSHYTLNDVSLGDLDGDGVVEFIVKRPCDVAADPAQKNCFNVLDCYNMQGDRLWWIDLGPNMLSGPDEQWDCVSYDWDRDGRAEVLLRIEDNAYIHYADGTSELIGDATTDLRWSGIKYTSSGNEYLLYLEGQTGRPYDIGPAEHPHYMDFPNTRGTDEDWGKGIVGHRSTKHYFGAPFLDGRHASIFLGRGAYTMHKMTALDVDPATHRLTQRWHWEQTQAGSPWFGQGYHNYQIADVDWDGRDEIVFGSMVLDDNGLGLSTTGLGHGDAQHCSDLDPYRHGQEQFACNEDMPANNFRDATTSKIYYRLAGGGDDGRALMDNFTDDYPGSQGRTVGSGWISSASDKIIAELNGDAFISWGDLNQRIYWDGDLCDEYFDSPGTEGYGAIYKPASQSAGGQRWNFPDSKCSNYSKNNPGAIADIFGDWREELVMRKADNTALLIYTTPIPTTYRIPTLWSDHQYRNAMVWQSMGYNQPPHKSYFLGRMEGITQAPPPLTMTGRTEIANGGTITTTDDHLILCETNDMQVSIEDGASPYMVTFNVPSHVEGHATSNTSDRPDPTYTYYTCTVTGGALTGGTRLVKQGDGVLKLPAVAMTYTGETNIWAGRLDFDGTLRQSTLWLNRFAELNSAGSLRRVKADYASIIRPQGEMTADTLNLGFGARLVVNLTSEGFQADKINTQLITVEKKTGTAWEKYGPKYLTPVLEVVGHPATGETLLAPGDYDLGAAQAVTGSLSDIKIEGITGQKSTLAIKDGRLVLTVTGVRDAATVYWTGATDGTWDYADALNFDNSGTQDFFVTGDHVVFDDAAHTTDVTLVGDLDPEVVEVNSAKNFTFSGMGSLTGACRVVKNGTGTLTINTANTYTGTTLVSGGTLRAAELSNENHATGALGLVSIEAGHITLENGATLQTTADVTTATPLRTQTPAGGTLDNSTAFNMNASISGTRLTKKGNGWLNLYKDNTKLDTLAITAGTVAASCAMPAKMVELAGGTLAYSWAGNAALRSLKGKQSRIDYGDSRGTYNNKLTGEGTVTVSYPLVSGGATRCHLTGDWSKFTGTVKPVGKVCFDNTYGLPLATMDLAADAVVQFPGKAYTIGQLTGKGSIGGTCSFSQSAVTAANTLTLGTADNFTFEGLLTGNTNVVKAGEGKMTHKGKGDYTGTTRVNAGELCLNTTNTTDAQLGTGALTIARGGTLSGKGVLANTSVTVSAGGTLRSGITETNASGNLRFSQKNVTVNGTIQTYVSTKTTYSRFTDIGTLRLNGTLVLNLREGFAPAEGGTELTLFDAATTALGANFKVEVTPGYLADTSRLASEGVVVITVDPDYDAIQAVTLSDLAPHVVYTIDGRRLEGKPRVGGVYVIDGRKVRVE